LIGSFVVAAFFAMTSGIVMHAQETINYASPYDQHRQHATVR
jgi:hypothetical protein